MRGSPFSGGAAQRDGRGGREVLADNQRTGDRLRRLESLRAEQIPVDDIAALAGSTDIQAALEALTSYSMPVVSAPATASDTGVAGTIAYDANYLYVCVATDTWKRTALSTW